MAHLIDLVPVTATGVDATCWLDTDITRVVLGCTCGWRGQTLATGPEAVSRYSMDCASDEALFEVVLAAYETAHADAIVPAFADLTAPDTDVFLETADGVWTVDAAPAPVG